MATTTLDFGNTLNADQTAALIASSPKTRFLVRGEPGIGKSALLMQLRKMLGDAYSYAYVDCGNLDLGDVAMPVVNRDKGITEYYPNSRFKLHEGKPVVIMLDEFSKGADPVKNMLHPMLEKNNPRLGDVFLPEGSIVFLTGNLMSDGVGDNLKAHSQNRVCEVIMRKPTDDEWMLWGVGAGIAPEVLAFVKQYPQVMASYIDGNQKDNPYIYNPKVPQRAFLSPRSLETASEIVKARKAFTEDTLIAALSGTIGEAAARDMQAFVHYQDQLPSWETIIKEPKKATVPDSPGACAVLVFGAIAKFDDKSIGPFMEYLKRFDEEWQACFGINVAKTPSKQDIAFADDAFSEWIFDNEDLL